MSEAAFEAYLARSIPEYAAEKVRAGSWHPDDALRRSQEGHAKLLPDGIATPGHFLFELVEASTNLVNWITFTNVIATDTLMRFPETGAFSFRERYYRARQGP